VSGGSAPAGAGGESPLDAALLQLAELRDQVSLLEAARGRDAERIDELAAAAAAWSAGGGEGNAKGYRPVPSRRWWELDATTRAEAVARLESWVDVVLRPGYGHLADKLGPCWPQHDLCLYLLDWLSEMHTFLYQEGGRPMIALATQAEWHVHLLPFAMQQMEEETRSCDHLRPEDQGAGHGDPWAGMP
jgi:hypothetical protein